jgi:16S rRNA (cytosine967-C5)-methyltransferase
VNGVLRKIARSGKEVSSPDRDLDEVFWLSVHHSHPKWMIERWLRRFGKEKTEKILESNNEHPPLSLWINTKRFSTKRAMERFQKDDVQVIPSRYLENSFIVKQGYPHKASLFKEGGCYIQDEAAQLIPSLLGQTLSGIAADICCAPGGKGLKMAHDGQDCLFVIGIDVSLSRLSMIKENLHRLQITHFSPVVADAEGRSPLKRNCDFILVDAPCSGTGVIRRNPEIKWRLQRENMRSFQDRQLAILNTVSHGVKRGGCLLYSVCSIEAEENEQVVRSFLSSNSHFHLENPSNRIPQKIHRFLDQEGYFRTYPYRDNMDGFFAALFRCKN